MGGTGVTLLQAERGECVALLGADGVERAALLETIAAEWDALLVRRTDPLFARLTIAGNLAFARPGRSGAPNLLDLLGVSGLDRLASERPPAPAPALRARVLLARAFASGRRLILDEPFDGLGSQERWGLQMTLRRLIERFDTPVVLATADRSELLACGDRIGVLEDGGVARLGTAVSLLASPGSAAAAAILLEAQLFPGRVEEDPPDRDDANVHLACGGTMPARLAETVGPGDVCLVAVRPDQVAFSSLRNQDLGGAAIPVTLVDIRNLGDHLRLRVRLQDGSQIWIRRPAASLKPHDIARASEPQGASLAWRASDAIAYPNE